MIGIKRGRRIGDRAARVRSRDQAPISNTAAGLLAIEPDRHGETFALAQSEAGFSGRP